jgi:hypothetical protein
VFNKKKKFSYLISDFGDDHLSTIITHYETSLKSGGVDKIEAVLEWIALKNALYQ